MNRPFVGAIVAAIAVLVGTGAFLLAPRLQGRQAKVLAKTNEHTERARRLLYQFSQNQERITDLTEALARTGLGPDIDVRKLLGDEQNRAAVEEEDRRLKGISGRRLGTNVDQMTLTLTQGLRERERLAAENHKLLEQALGAVNQGLGESSGNVSGSDDVLANRLKGVILYYYAQTYHQEADFLRQDAVRFRDQVAALGAQAQGLVQEKDLVTSSGIDALLATAEQGVTDADARLTDARASAAAIQAKVDELKSRIATVRSTAEQARTAMENMQAQGVDLSQPGGFEPFAAEFNRWALNYRQALAELHRLETGTLLNAQIDSSGDFLTGRYVPAEADRPMGMDRGLVGLEMDLAQAQLKMTAAQAAAQSARTLRDSLAARRTEYQQRAAQATARLGELAKEVGAAYAELARLTGTAEQAQTTAIDLYGKSARAFTDAARLAAARASEARTAVDKLSAEAKQRSPDTLIADETWLEDLYKVNAADAQISLGRLYYTISDEAKQIADVLAALPQDLTPPGVDPAAWRDKHDEARTDGLDVLHKAYDALQRTRGRLAGQWTLAAEAAAAADLLVLLGEEDLRGVAINTYEAIVGGQENQPHLQPYVERLKALRRP